MKKIYQKPVMQAERFIPNECIAACGDSGAEYKFECTSPAGHVYIYQNSPATGARPEANSKPTQDIGGYEPCGYAHSEPTAGVYVYGFVDRGYYDKWGFYHQRDGKESEGEAAIIYLEYNKAHTRITNWHATGNLDISQWEITKS